MPIFINSKLSRKRLGGLAAALILAIIIAVLVWLIGDRTENENNVSSHAPVVNTDVDPNETDSEEAKLDLHLDIEQQSNSETGAKDLPKTTSPFFSQEMELLEHDSPEMELWKEQNIMPDSSDMDQYRDMDLGNLQRAAKSGDVLAQKALGNRLVRQHYNERDGLEWLIEAASYGSQEALRELRWIYQFGAGPIERDKYAFLAWSKVSYMLGDWQALWPFGTQAMLEIGLEKSIIVEVMAANFFSEINRRHFERTGRNMEISLRPGYDQALEEFLDK